VSAAFTDSYLALHKLLCELQQTVARINIFAEERYQAACEVVNKGFAPAAGFEAACVQGLIAVDPIAGSHRDPNDVCPSFAVKVDETLCTCVPRAYTEQYMVFDGLCAIPWLSGDGIVWDAKRFFHCCSAPVVRRPAPNCQCVQCEVLDFRFLLQQGPPADGGAHGQPALTGALPRHARAGF